MKRWTEEALRNLSQQRFYENYVIQDNHNGIKYAGNFFRENELCRDGLEGRGFSKQDILFMHVFAFNEVIFQKIHKNKLLLGGKELFMFPWLL